LGEKSSSVGGQPYSIKPERGDKIRQNNLLVILNRNI